MCSVIFRANTKKNNTKRYSQTANRKLKWNTKKHIQVIQKGQERPTKLTNLQLEGLRKKKVKLL